MRPDGLYSDPSDLWERAELLVENCQTPPEAISSAWALQNVLHDLVQIHKKWPRTGPQISKRLILLVRAGGLEPSKWALQGIRGNVR